MFCSSPECKSFACLFDFVCSCNHFFVVSFSECCMREFRRLILSTLHEGILTIALDNAVHVSIFLQYLLCKVVIGRKEISISFISALCLVMSDVLVVRS